MARIAVDASGIKIQKIVLKTKLVATAKVTNLAIIYSVNWGRLNIIRFLNFPLQAHLNSLQNLQ